MLIGMLLEDMLTDMGHEVAAIVPRLKEALVAVERKPSIWRCWTCICTAKAHFRSRKR